MGFLAIDWLEARYGANPSRLTRMVEGFHPAIRTVAGTEETSRLFGDVTNVPALFVFDRNGRLAFHRQSKRHLSWDEIAEVVDGLK